MVAVGAEPAPGLEKVPGAKEHAIPFYSIEDSYRVKQAIRELKVRYVVAVALTLARHRLNQVRGHRTGSSHS